MATDRNDELLSHILAGQGDLLALLGDIRDRLPVPTVAGQPAPAEPAPVEVEPVQVAEPGPRRMPAKKVAAKPAVKRSDPAEGG